MKALVLNWIAICRLVNKMTNQAGELDPGVCHVGWSHDHRHRIWSASSMPDLVAPEGCHQDFSWLAFRNGTLDFLWVKSMSEKGVIVVLRHTPRGNNNPGGPRWVVVCAEMHGERSAYSEYFRETEYEAEEVLTFPSDQTHHLASMAGCEGGFWYDVDDAVAHVDTRYYNLVG
jgi:hypothetical protein